MQRAVTFPYLSRVREMRPGSSVRTEPRPIISVGRDTKLLSLREKAITGASDLAVQSLAPEDADAVLRRSGPALWIFCQTIEFPRLIFLAWSVRRSNPEHKLLLLQGARPVTIERSLFHQVLPPAHSMESLLDAISDLTIAP